MRDLQEPQKLHVRYGSSVHVKTCHNSFRPPASRSVIKRVCAKLGLSDPALAELYSTTDGLILFESDSDDTDDGKYFVPPIWLYGVKDLESRTSEFEDTLAADPDLAEAWPIYKGGVCIGEPRGTGNNFIYIRHGRRAGSIFYFDHDPDRDWHRTPYASSLAEFMARISEPPYRGIKDICGADGVRVESGV